METWEIEWSFTTITLKLYVVSRWILVRNGGHGGVSHGLTIVIVGQMYEFNHTAKVEIEVYLGSTKHFYVLRLMDMFQRYVIKKIYRCTVNTCPNSKLTPNLKYCWYFSIGELSKFWFSWWSNTVHAEYSLDDDLPEDRCVLWPQHDLPVGKKGLQAVPRWQSTMWRDDICEKHSLSFLRVMKDVFWSQLMLYHAHLMDRSIWRYFAEVQDFDQTRSYMYQVSKYSKTAKGYPKDVQHLYTIDRPIAELLWVW